MPDVPPYPARASPLRRLLLAFSLILLGSACWSTASASASVSYVGSNVASGTASFFGSATATVTVPAAANDGDLMIATVTASASGTWTSSAYTAASGWTLLDSDTTGMTAATYYRIANNEPNSYAWSYLYPGGAGGASVVAEIDVYRGEDQTTPLTAGNSSTGSGTSVTFPSDTSANAGAMRISSVMSYTANTTASVATLSAALTQASHKEATTGQDANEAAGYAVQGVGATAAATATLSKSVTRWLAATYVVNPTPPTKVAFTTQPVGGVAEATNLATQPSVSVEFPDSTVATSNTSSVTLAIASGPAGGVLSCTGGLTKAATAGVATFAGCQITGTAAAGSYTLIATDGTLTSATSASFTIVAGAAAKVAFSTQPVGGVAEGVNLATQPGVTIQDTYGNTASGNTSSVTLAIASGPAAGVLTCTTNPKAATAGVVVFAGCQITGTQAAGTYTLTATDGALTAATSTSFTIIAGAASKLAFTVQPVGGVAEGVALPTQPQVSVQDTYGNVASSSTASVSLGIASGPAGASGSCPTNPVPASSGVAAFSGCVVNGTAGAGAYTLLATASGLTSATSASFTIIVGAAAKVAFTTQPVGGVAENVALPTQPAVSIQDAYANVVTTNTSSVTLAIASGPGTGVLTCTANPLAASAGVAAFAGCKITGTAAAGTYTLTATDGALTSATSSNFTIIVGAASKLAFTTQPGGGVTLGAFLSPQPVVAVQDAYANVVTTDTSAVTLTIASGPAAGSIACNGNPASASAGAATFAGCRINGAGATGTYTLLASDSALTPATSSSFTIIAGSLSINSSGYAFTGITLNGQNQTATATLVLDVLDTTGSGSGWRVSASTAAWTGGTSGALTAAQVASVQPAAATCDGGTGSCTPATPTGAVTWPTALSSTPVALYNAAAGTGLGPQTVNVPLTLPVPGGVIAKGTFTQNVTVTVAAGP